MAGDGAGVAVRAGASAADWFRWGVARAAVLRGLYLCLALGPAEIAARFGQGCTPESVSTAVRRLGLKRERRAGRGGFTWTAARKATLRRLYVDEGLTREACARAIGEGCTARKVTRAVATLGLADLRSAKGHRVRFGRPAAVRPPAVVKAATARRERPRGGSATPWASDRRMAYADRFLDAGWAPGEVAWLFNLDARLLAGGEARR